MLVAFGLGLQYAYRDANGLPTFVIVGFAGCA